MNDKYLESLIESARVYVHKLQYLAVNNRTTLRAINTLKMLHQIYGWAVAMNASESTKESIQELMHCVILGNSNLVMPEIIPGPEYSNVNTPQTEYTWQDVYGTTYETLTPSTSGTITINKIVLDNSLPVENNTLFAIEVTTPTGLVLRNISQDSSVVLTNAPFGEYTISEITPAGYVLDSITPSTFTTSELNPNRTVTITNSVCGEEIDCECVVSFDYYEENSVSVLSVGELLGTPCVLDEYVIDWFRNGEHAMVSGKGSDPDIQTFHPFVGIEAVPVLAGTWVPVVRYIVVNGVRIFSDSSRPEGICDDWCSSLINLPVIIVVSPLDCSSTSSPVTPGYNYRLSYSSSQDYNLASRTIMFMLPEDLSAKYFAVFFTGYEVADRVQVFFKDSTTPISDWAIGTRYMTEDTFNMPGEIYISGQRFVFELPTYEDGDYLIIKITPSVNESNPRTDWQLEMKCLDDSYIFDCNVLTSDTMVITEVRLVDNPAACRWELYVKIPTTNLGYTTPGNPLFNFYRYSGLSVKSSTYTLSSPSTYELGSYFTYASTVNLFATLAPNANTYIDASGTITISKTGNVLTFVCDNVNDYNSFVDGYNYLVTQGLPTYPFSFIILTMRYRPGGCGDGYTTQTFYIAGDSSVNFTGGNTISITLNTMTHMADSPACDSTSTSINSYVDAVNNVVALADFNGVNAKSTMCRPTYPLGYGVRLNGTNHYNISDVLSNRHYYMKGNLVSPCEDIDGFYQVSNDYQRPIYGIRSVITAEKDINGNYIEDPTLNYKVYSRIGDDGMLKTTDQRLLYEIADGIITNNLPSY